VDIEVILDSAEIEAPALSDTARRFLVTAAWDLGVPLDPASVLLRRAEGWPELHITAAAGEMVAHLAGSEENPLGEESALMTLARIGAQAVMTRAQMEGGRNPACR
jgi:hypothetical protein